MEAVHRIRFVPTDDGSGLLPSAPQYAGVQGDHNAAYVEFQLPAELQQGYRLRVEYVDGAGRMDLTGELTPSEGCVGVPLPRAWTAAGGCAVIRLVATAPDVDGEEQAVYSAEGRLRFDGRDNAGEIEEAVGPGLLELIDSAEQAAAAAAAAASGAEEAAAAAEEAAMTANAAAASANRLSETMNNELHGEAIHLTYEIGGFDVSQGGEVVAAIRARPVDKAIFVRNGMRVTGGGTYQVDVTEVDSAGAVVKHLCNYADEYVMQEDGYIRFSVKSVANPTTAVTEEDLLLIAEKVVILNDNSVDKRFERMSATLEAETGKLAERMSNELYGEFLRFGYEIGGFDIVDGEVVAAIRARPVDKAIFVRKGMRVTGGGVYQVYVVAVDSTGAALEVLCSYANEYVAQADGYIRYTVKSIANPDTELTEADLPLIAEKVVIRKDDNVNKRIGTLAETMNNELYGEALHLEYEVGGFDASLGQVNTKVRARPVDKAIFVRKGMRITGGGTYQVDVTEVDSAGAVGKHLCSYADEYVMQEDGYIRFMVKNAANPTAAVTEEDLLTVAEKVVILNDNSVNKRLEALEESDRFWATSGTWDIRQGFSGSDYTQNANGNVDVPADTVLYRDAVTDLLFQKLTWTFKVNTVGAFAFGTRDGSGAANGYYVLVNPADKTLKIYNSDWKGTLSIKRNLTIDFDILAGETYYAEIIKTGTLSTEFTLKCISAPGKTFSYTHNQLNNKLRGWGGVAFGSAGGVFELVNMTQRARSEAECEVLLIGDSFLENASSELESEYAYAYKLREKLGEKLIASGRGGATTTALKNKYTTDFLAAKAKYTVLQIGSNDSLSLTVATFKMNLLELIGRVEENGSIPVLVTIPRRYDTDNTTFITEVNAWIKSLGYWYIDEYALLPADRLLNDTIHPNAEGHDLILSNLLALIPV